MTNDAFPTFEDFKEAADVGKVVEVTPQMDSRISYRSGTTSKEELLNLIRGYASYPQFRNEKTIDGLYAAFQNNTEMTMPLVLEFPNGKLRVMGGNTRMDVAFQLGLNPKVLVIKVPQR